MFFNQRPAAVLDARVLIEMTINPESLLRVPRGPAVLVQGGWRTFLVEVRNEAHTTAPLAFRSPQGGSHGPQIFACDYGRSRLYKRRGG